MPNLNNGVKLSPKVVQQLITYINELPSIDEEKKESMINVVKSIKYDPEYTSAFTGNIFEGEDKEYYQVKDKIDGYLKGYSDFDGGRRKTNNRRRTNKRRRTNNRKTKNY